MSETDIFLSELIGTTKLGLEAQLRTRFYDEVLRLKEKGFSEKEIDDSLIKKIWRENPKKAKQIFAREFKKTTRQETVEILKGLETYKNQDIEDLDEELIENCRLLSDSARQMSKKVTVKKYKKPISKISYIQKHLGVSKNALLSAWFIWFLIIFSLNIFEFIELSYGHEWLSWLLLPPLIVVSIIVWVKKFLLSK
jgi:hypothetical protein